MLRRAWECLLCLGIASLTAEPATALASATPVPVGFYYGWVTPQTAAEVQGYSAVVLGADSESSGYANQQAVEQLISANPSISFYGYVNLSDGSSPVPIPELAQEFAEWKALGPRHLPRSRRIQLRRAARAPSVGCQRGARPWDAGCHERAGSH